MPSYDALNRVTNMVDAAGTTRYSYSAFGAALSEDGPWENDTVSYNYANRLRTALTLQQPNASSWNQSYTYDLSRRLATVTSPVGQFSYNYLAAGQLVTRLVLPNSLDITNLYDSVGRVLYRRIYLPVTDDTFYSHAYTYNQGGQRTNIVRLDLDYANYSYDNIGQLSSVSAWEYGGTVAREHERFDYYYDAAGNLTNRTTHGDSAGVSHKVNGLNQITNISRSTNLNVAGNYTFSATVTVNGQAATLYNDRTFSRTGLGLIDGTNSFTAIAQGSSGTAEDSVSVYLPASLNYAYDANGNLTNDSVRAFSYDDENQLASIAVANAWKSEFVYDGKMRRRVRKEFVWSSGSSSWVLSNEVRYVYDGNLVIQERNGLNLPQVAYTRGNDLSGSLEGAGGIGGLLARTHQTGLTLDHAYYYADGNGNVTMLISPKWFPLATYLYDSFGNVLSMSGLWAEANLYRFSSKEMHQNSALSYYLYRYYEPNLQRWLNGDLIGEQAVLNLYAFVGNSPLGHVDPLGLDFVPKPWPPPIPPGKPYWPPPPPPPPKNPPCPDPVVCITTCVNDCLIDFNWGPCVSACIGCRTNPLLCPGCVACVGFGVGGVYACYAYCGGGCIGDPNYKYDGGIDSD